MSAIEEAQDVAGVSLLEGDTVATVNGQMSGKVCEARVEDGMEFVRVRPTHQPYGKGMWYPADQVFRVARPKAKVKAEPPPQEQGRGRRQGRREGRRQIPPIRARQEEVASTAPPLARG